MVPFPSVSFFAYYGIHLKWTHPVPVGNLPRTPTRLLSVEPFVQAGLIQRTDYLSRFPPDANLTRRGPAPRGPKTLPDLPPVVCSRIATRRRGSQNLNPLKLNGCSYEHDYRKQLLAWAIKNLGLESKVGNPNQGLR